MKYSIISSSQYGFNKDIGRNEALAKLSENIYNDLDASNLVIITVIGTFWKSQENACIFKEFYQLIYVSS